MRNPERISRTTQLLEAFWHKNPDLRLSQIVAVIENEAKKITQADFFYVEDNCVAHILERLLKDEKGL